MSKRAEERSTGEEPVVAKSRPGSFDFKKFERESISHVGFWYIVPPGENADWVGILTSQALRKEAKTQRQVLKRDTER